MTTTTNPHVGAARSALPPRTSAPTIAP
jgi:hypothetical protein